MARRAVWRRRGGQKGAELAENAPFWTGRMARRAAKVGRWVVLEASKGREKGVLVNYRREGFQNRQILVPLWLPLPLRGDEGVRKKSGEENILSLIQVWTKRTENIPTWKRRMPQRIV